MGWLTSCPESAVCHHKKRHGVQHSYPSRDAYACTMGASCREVGQVIEFIFLTGPCCWWCYPSGDPVKLRRLGDVSAGTSASSLCGFPSMQLIRPGQMMNDQA